MSTKKELFGIELRVYLRASRKEKAAILDTLERQTGMHRLSIIRAFRRLQMGSAYTPLGRRGRKIFYDHDCLSAVQFLWESADYCCGELLHPVIRERIELAQHHGLWVWDEEVTGKVMNISVATLKRKIPKWRTFPVKRGVSTTTPSTIKDAVPLFEGDWKQVSIGSGQVDTVAHCGGSMAGEFVFSCGYIDVASGWYQYQAQWNKGMIITQESLSSIQNQLPFPLSMIHPDCGSEFLNQFVMKWSNDQGIAITRSRSYHKNDNGYIEQRNDHVVRKWFGYVRLGHRELVEPMNEFYNLLALYSNHFQAQRLCIGTKEAHSGRIRKMYEKNGMTPYQRLLSRDDVSSEIKQNLTEQHKTLNPFTLLKELYRRRDAILEMNRRLTQERGLANS
jgi:hypothetical protein